LKKSWTVQTVDIRGNCAVALGLNVTSEHSCTLMDLLIGRKPEAEQRRVCITQFVSGRLSLHTMTRPDATIADAEGNVVNAALHEVLGIPRLPGAGREPAA